MQTREITKEDFDEIVEVIDRWWDGPMSTFAHPIFFYELGDKALIVESDGVMIGFLLGFIAHHPVKTGYVHLVGIHPDCRRKGVGRALYDEFARRARLQGAVRLKAITTPGNQGSVEFHRANGYDVQLVDDYAGPNRARYVFTRDL